MTKSQIQRLEAWTMKITATLNYQPEIPLVHKQDISKALKLFQDEILKSKKKVRKL